jgi:hypothetical protein
MLSDWTYISQRLSAPERKAAERYADHEFQRCYGYVYLAESRLDNEQWAEFALKFAQRNCHSIVI